MRHRRRVVREAGPPKATPVPGPPPPPHCDPEITELDRAVVLVGPMAAGKTSLGKRLARTLNVPFIDSDARIVQLHGAISQIFDKQGEDVFRDLEAAVIASELAKRGPRIVALGGGAVLRESTRRLLERHPVVLLMTTEKAVLKTANLSRRPLLKNNPGAWQSILDQRKSLYQEVADTTFRTDRFGQSQLTAATAKWIKNWVRQQSNTHGTDTHDQE